MKTKALAVAAFALLLTLAHTSAQEPSSDKPRQITVNELGAVNRPGRYLLPEGATALDALGAAGGERPEADLKKVVCIHAVVGDKPSTDRINMKAVLKGIQAAPVLHEGDSLKLDRQLTSVAF